MRNATESYLANLYE